MSLFIGCDPGRSGGIACINDRLSVLDFIDFSKCTPREILRKLNSWNKDLIRAAMIESVGAFPGQGVHSMFVFGEHYGMEQMALIAADISFMKVAPVTWKIALNISRKKGKTTQSERKKISRALAQQYFPREDINNQNAEALLLAFYCRKMSMRGED